MILVCPMALRLCFARWFVLFSNGQRVEFLCAGRKPGEQDQREDELHGIHRRKWGVSQFEINQENSSWQRAADDGK